MFNRLNLVFIFPSKIIFWPNLCHVQIFLLGPFLLFLSWITIFHSWSSAPIGGLDEFSLLMWIDLAWLLWDWRRIQSWRDGSRKLFPKTARGPRSHAHSPHDFIGSTGEAWPVHPPKELTQAALLVHCEENERFPGNLVEWKQQGTSLLN